MDRPRPYLSWSQLSLFKISPNQYRERYLEKKEFPPNKYMILGSKLADRLDSGIHSGDPLIEHLAIFLPKGEDVEYKYEVDWKGIRLLCKFDAFSPKAKKRTIREYKTGKNWNQRKADNHGQLLFYSCAVYAKEGIIPEIFLDWAETKENDFGDIELTGRIETFEVKFKLSDIIRFRKEITDTWEGIKKLTKEYNKQNA